MSDIHFILTGGTIEKTYNPITEKTEFQKKNTVENFLHDKVHMHLDCDMSRVCQFDSLDINDDIRAEILKAVEESKADKIVIIHGTSTMELSAQYLASHLPHTEKTIILTGAMIPLKEFAMSDGGFNLGYAIASVQHANPGVYVAMNATLFDACDVVKNVDIGCFEKKS